MGHLLLFHSNHLKNYHLLRKYDYFVNWGLCISQFKKHYIGENGNGNSIFTRKQSKVSREENSPYCSCSINNQVLFQNWLHLRQCTLSGKY